MRIEQLRYILEITHQKSISKAAKTLFISQPSLSNAVASLEDELGSPLFIRGRDGVVPTEFGLSVLNRARKIMEQVEDIRSISLNDVYKQVGKVEILSVPLFCNWLLIDTMFEVKKTFSNIDIIVTEKKNINIISELASSKASIGILGIGDKYKEAYYSRIKEKGFEFQRLFSNNICAFIHHSHPLAQKDAVTLADLEKETIVTYDDFRYNTVLNGNSFANISPEGRSGLFLLNDNENIKNLVARNNAIAVLPHMLAINNIYVEMGLVKIVPISDLNEVLIVGLLYDKNCIWSVAEKGFVDAMQEIIAGYRDKNSFGFLPVN